MLARPSPPIEASPVLGLVETGLHEVTALDGANLEVEDVAPGPRPEPWLEHGTFAATLLAGRDPTHPGVATDVPLRIALVGGRGRIAPEHVAAALERLAERGARWIAVPLGVACELDVVESALERVTRQGIAVFAAAGDSHPAPIEYPARSPRVVAVGGVDEAGRLLPGCNRRPRLDATSPGFACSFVREGVLARRRGTSIACVLAAAAAARDPQPEGNERPCPNPR